jgi:predicted DNA-binding transcriptional regulator YafY
VDAWCHLRKGVRSFSIDAITTAEMLALPAKDISSTQLKKHFEKGYGIFSGKNVRWAKLRFSPSRARWVSSESWHPEQRGSYESDGSYLLELPYSDDRELLMDVLRHGNEVEILEPKELRSRVKSLLKSALNKY